jgi:hypothetical protein
MPGFLERRRFVFGAETIPAPLPSDDTLRPLVRPLVTKKGDKCMELRLMNEPTFWDKFQHI